jgi:hypothetical protein
MWNSRWPRLAVVLALILAAGTVSSARAEKLLRWKFKTGDKNRFTMTQVMQSKVIFQEKPINTTMTNSLDFTWEVAAVDEKGVATLTQAIDRVRLKMQGPQGMAFEYDSRADKKPEGLAGMIAPVFEAMVGKSFNVKMDGRGKVLEVKFPKGLLESLKKVPGASQAGAMFTEESMKGMTEMGVLPEKPVNSGDAWKQESTMKNPFLGEIKIEVTYRYLGTESRDGKELDKIGLEMKMQSAPGKPGEMKAKIGDQESTGTLFFDEALGQFVGGTVKTTLKMQISLGGQNINQDIEMTQEWKRTSAGTKE